MTMFSNKTAGLLVTGIALTFFCTACSTKAPQATDTANSTQSDTAKTTTKVGDTTKSGKITKIGSKFYLQMTGKEPIELDSYTLNLSSYVGQTATVTGQYSGDTLFVAKIE